MSARSDLPCPCGVTVGAPYEQHQMLDCECVWHRSDKCRVHIMIADIEAYLKMAANDSGSGVWD